MKSKTRLGKTLCAAGAWAVAAMVLGATGAGCLSRPLGHEDPTTKTNFTSTVSQQAVDKVDLLFAIDNSSSMGDKQAILKDAVPDLLTELLRPKCLSKTDGVTWDGTTRADPSGSQDDNFKCPDGTEPEFKPVTDMHIGVVSSSLGDFGGHVCPNDATHTRTDDHGLLVNVNGLTNGTENPPNPAAPDNFLAWFPQNQANTDPKRHPPPAVPIRTTDGDQGLTINFQNMVAGIDQTGCGLEAQLESVYRFLIQPDPFDQVAFDSLNQADLGQGADNIAFDVLKQRADFLRPDSLVAIIMLSDEDDSSADPLSVGGLGYAFMARDFPISHVPRGASAAGKTAPRATSTCDTDPNSDDCTSCGFASSCDVSSAWCQKIKQDPNCTQSGLTGQSGPGYDGYYPPTDDELNVRFFHMKQRYGVDPQYPISRYVNGLTKRRVPDRSTEHSVTLDAKQNRHISEYNTGSGALKCTNPLFAQALPRAPGDEVCMLAPSTRTPDRIFFAMVGGVPNGLLHFTPGDSAKSAITGDDWVKILGKDPMHFDYSGIDAHMIQSIGPRSALLEGGDPNLPRGQNGSDPVQGREWATQKRDLQYACTFDLPQERNCVANPQSCDCADDPSGGTAPNPPLCKSDGSATQVKAKAYPTVREFELVHALGDQGVIASLCPIQLNDDTAPTYGYRPAVSAIIDRLKNALTTQCLPHKLRSADDQATATATPVPCLVLVQLSPDSGQHCADLKLGIPDDKILTVFRQQQRDLAGNVGDGGVNPATFETCQLEQSTVAPGASCADDPTMKWCYVEMSGANKPGGRCSQALVFSSGTAALTNARFSLQCIEQASTDGGH